MDISSRFFEPVRGDLLVQLFSRLDYGIHPLRSRSVSGCVETIFRSDMRDRHRKRVNGLHKNRRKCLYCVRLVPLLTP
jgi:hypothetical protein